MTSPTWGGGSAHYSISVIGKMGDRRERRGQSRLKKWVTSFIDGPQLIFYLLKNSITFFYRKCQRPGCQNSCSNVRSSVKNFCSPQCSQIMNLSSSSASSSKPDLRPRRVFTELHNTLPRSSKSEDDLLSRGPKLVQSCISPPPPPVKEKQNNNNNTFDDKKVSFIVENSERNNLY